MHHSRPARKGKNWFAAVDFEWRKSFFQSCVVLCFSSFFCEMCAFLCDRIWVVAIHKYFNDGWRWMRFLERTDVLFICILEYWLIISIFSENFDAIEHWWTLSSHTVKLDTGIHFHHIWELWFQGLNYCYNSIWLCLVVIRKSISKAFVIGIFKMKILLCTHTKIKNQKN